MESLQLSMLSSLTGEPRAEDFVLPHYKESYRMAIDHLVNGGKDSYQEFLQGERLGSFLSEDELSFIMSSAQKPTLGEDVKEADGPLDSKSSTGTYWPMHSDVETPDLELGWPEFLHNRQQTHVELLFHPPRQNNPTIKEVIRKHIQDARQVIAIVMDVFTDVDIFKETVDASNRGVPVYILLDDFHLKSFLTMVENQDIKIQKLRNMRVRTVKGQEYLCRSGAKFHGGMEQKFLLIDCHTVIYGSYSFMWSYEKINLSMVQAITGHLVQSYDEEFRTLYARSTIPAGLCPLESTLQENRPNGRHILARYTPHGDQTFERKDQLRHTLDAVYRKTCERQISMRDIDERLYEDDRSRNAPFIDYGMGAPNLLQHFKPAETTSFLKRHSYAGERQDAPYTPQNAKYRASNWNVSGDMFSGGKNHYPAVDNYLQHAPQLYRSHNMRQSYNGNDKQMLHMQQNMPTLENTSKSFLRTWRIESYLNNTDTPTGDSCDYLDQYEALENKPGPYMHSRIRSSVVFNTAIPEQRETNSSSTLSQTSTSAMSNTTPYYSPMQWNQKMVAENKARNEEMLKRRSLQVLDDQKKSAGYGPVGNAHNSIYNSLGRAKTRQVKASDILADSWNKRHSVADPRSKIDEYTNHIYGGPSSIRHSENVQNGGYISNLSEDQRSVSHYDVKTVRDRKGPSAANWQEPPSRTVSAATLDADSKETTHKSSQSPRFLKNSSKKIRSFLNIPEKKGSSSRSQKLDSSSDTILGDDDTQKSLGSEKNLCPSSTSSTRCLAEQKKHTPVDPGKSSKPRFHIEETNHNSTTAVSVGREEQRTQTASGEKPSPPSTDWRREGRADSRLYSRYEPFCVFEKKQSCATGSTAKLQLPDKAKGVHLPKVGIANDLNLNRGTHGLHDNKLGKFIQRVGNLIHKK